MLKIIWLLALQGFLFAVMAQQVTPKKINKNQFKDSIVIMQWKENNSDDLPVTGFNENERTETGNSVLPSILTANRDVLMMTAGFHFSVLRFRLRGYDGACFNTDINGIPMNDPENGVTQWGLWGGLNDVTRNVQSSLGLRVADAAFGNIGTATQIDIRAFKQRAQTQFAYAFSNRSFTHRYTFTHGSGMNKKGWAYTISGSIRYAGEGYVAGSSYNGKSFFVAIDKKLDESNIVSFAVFDALLVTGKQSAVLAESAQLAGTHYYNAYWGYQAGEKRNANTRSANEPVAIVTLDHKTDNQTGWILSAGFVTGQRSDTGLDWYKAADPRPDYYRYLPSYQKDPLLRKLVTEAIEKNSALMQVNWDHMFEVNRNSNETVFNADGIQGNSVSGLRSRYIVENRVVATRQFTVSGSYHTLLTDGSFFTTGASLQLQRSNKYKKIDDLLGGDFYVDWNQFAERDFPDDRSAIQNDLARPDRILFKEAIFGYHYLVHSLLAKGWAQVSHSYKRVDLFTAAELSYTNYQRVGLVKNGLFPYNSLGRSLLNEFTGYGVKTGITYKINGRKYLYMQAGYFAKPPLFDNVFISPRTSNNEQENIKTEKIFSTEAGYIWSAPSVKIRLSVYATLFSDGMNISTFYHDGYRNFVNYALSGIGKLHYGIESGADIKLSSHFSVTGVLSIGRYYYNNRQDVTVTTDNNALVIERGIIYSKNFRIGGSPQEAYGIGISYQSPMPFYLNLSGSYFREQWLEFNPLRRTYAALEGVVEKTDQWNRIITQTQLPPAYTLDLSAGSSLKTRLFHSKHRKMILINISINNLLDNKNLISGGYEQLRFDTETKDPGKFPPKFFYAMGLNFSVNLTLRL